MVEYLTINNDCDDIYNIMNKLNTNLNKSRESNC